MEPLVFLLPMVPYVSTPVTRVLLTFLARYFTKNEVPEEEAAPERQKKGARLKIKSSIRYFHIPSFKLKTIN